MTEVFRFAPSPNGYLHLGHAYSALLNFDLARASGGRFVLRIEDIDATRCRPAYEAAIYEDLAWLGIAWEKPVRRQSEHMADYRAALGKLEAQGLLFASFESRAELARLASERERAGFLVRDPDGAPLYAGAGRSLSVAEREARIVAGEPYAIRLDTKAASQRTGPLSWTELGCDRDGEATDAVRAKPEAWGDVVLARKETPTSYHLSVVVDDAMQGITEVVRGADLFHATSVHRLLQELVGLPAPRYRHHRLILDAERRKLSKSTRAIALRELRAQGTTPTDIRRALDLDRVGTLRASPKE